jgi:hypothetical protein
MNPYPLGRKAMKGKSKSMRRSSLAVELVVLVNVALWLVACSCTTASTGSSSELEVFVAQAILDEQLDQAARGYRSPEGAIVALVATTETHGEPFSPKRVWRYSQGELKDEDPDTLDKALGDDRSEWPSFTFIFAFESVTSRRATIDVHTFYDMGITEYSRGGNAQKWELNTQSGMWVVSKKEPYMFWD